MFDALDNSQLWSLRIWWRELRLDFKIIIFLVIFAVFAGPLAWFIGVPCYEDWRQSRTLETARLAQQRGDAAACREAIRQFVASPAGSAKDWAEIAGMLDRSGGSASVKVWREVLHRAPGNADYRIRFLAAALREGDLASAGLALGASDPAFRAEREFPALAGRYYLRTGDFQSAQRELEQAVAVGHPDPGVLVEYGTLLSSSDQPERRDQGTKLLEQASADPSVRLDALRVLFQRDLTARWFYSAGQRLEALRHTTGSTFDDEMLGLDLALADEGHIKPDLIESLARAAAADPRHVEALAGWFLDHNRLAEAGQAIDTVDPASKGASALPLLRLHLACAEGDWPRAEKIARDDLHNARAADALGAALSPDPGAQSDVDWRSPLDRAGVDAVALDVLRAYYAATGQPKNEMPVIQALLDQTPSNQALWARLLGLCQATRDTAMLRRFTFELSKLAGNPPSLEGEVLTLDMLTDRVPPLEALHRALELRARSEASPAVANAEAFALARVGRPREALAIYRQFPARAWEDPAHQVLIGYAYARAGDHDAAEAQFSAAEAHTDQLLLEYSVLIQHARDEMAAKAAGTPAP